MATPQISMDAYVQGRYDQLTSHGENKGKDFIARHQIVKSSYFITPGGTLKSYKFFSDSDQDQQHQEGRFPNGAVAQDIMAVRISTNLTFDVGVNTKTLGAELQRFLDDSFIQFDLQKQEQTKIWLNSVFPQGFTLNPDDATDPAPVINHDKWGEWFRLKAPIQVGANKSLDINLKPADGLTTPADDATITPNLPGAGLDNDRGYVIRLYLDTIEYMTAN